MSDMLPHDREEYRQQMGHVWLGFSEISIAGCSPRQGSSGFGSCRCRRSRPQKGRRCLSPRQSRAADRPATFRSGVLDSLLELTEKEVNDELLQFERCTRSTRP